jgi:hypothetical protein
LLKVGDDLVGNPAVNVPELGHGLISLRHEEQRGCSSARRRDRGASRGSRGTAGFLMDLLHLCFALVHRGCPAQSFAKQVPATAPLRTFVSGAAQGFEVSGQSVALQSLAARWVACGDGMANQSERNGLSLARTSSSTCTGALQMKRDPRCSHEALRN